ncbi:exported hypothetical protein [metagenome]|uniref:Uncharacterized protein n=1 Tax=metagenome TaxID=256318 RepID=A0A2P2C6H5_9ZZZZ
MVMFRAVTVATLAGVLVVAGCASPDSDPSADHTLPPSSERVPLSFRAVGAIAVAHLPEASSVEATYQEPREIRAGRIAADLRLRPGPAEDGELVRVMIAPRFPALRCTKVMPCADLPSSGGAAVQLAWEREAPEEDPGYVVVRVSRPHEVAFVLYAGPAITGDPRKLELPVSIDRLVALATDPWLRLRTAPEAITAGDELTDWGGGEPPTPRRDWVPQTGDGLMRQFARGQGGADRWHDPEVSPYQDEFGAGTISGRLTRDATNESGVETVDLLVSKQPLPWLQGNTCRGSTYPGKCSLLKKSPFGPYLTLWTPTTADDPGEAWTIQVRPDETVAARLTGATKVTEKPAAWGGVYGSETFFEPTPAWGFLADPQIFLFPLPD